MSFLSILPMAIVMIAGPQILSVIMLATSEHWKRNTALYVLGAACSISIVVTAAYLLGSGASDAGASNEALYVVMLLLLLYAMVRTYVRRGESEPPRWMGRLQTANPRFSFTLGFLLLGVFPTDVVTSIAVGSFLAAQDESLWQALPFLALTLLLLSSPALILLAFGQRAEVFLPKARDWMTDNAWIVNEIVLALFVVIVAGNLV